MPNTDEELGRVAYEAWFKSAIDRNPGIETLFMPWDIMEGSLKIGYIAAAKAVRERIENREVDRGDKHGT